MPKPSPNATTQQKQLRHLKPRVSQCSNAASVTFRQDYRSDKLTSSNTKTLELVKADGRWQIREEKAGK